MPPLPVASSAEVIRVLERVGYRRQRQAGSHITMVNPSQGFRNVVVPQRKEMRKGTLRAIIRQADLTVEQFIELMGR